MNTQLVVPINEDSLKLGLMGMPFMVAVLFKLLYLSSSFNDILNEYVLIIIKSCLVFCIALFVAGFVFTVLQKISNKPVAILNQEGIWIRYWGFIPWDNVEEVNAFIVPTTPMEFIGIRLKDLDSYSQQASFSGKFGVFWVKLFGYRYHISISGIELDNDQVIQFSRQFMQ